MLQRRLLAAYLYTNVGGKPMSTKSISSSGGSLHHHLLISRQLTCLQSRKMKTSSRTISQPNVPLRSTVQNASLVHGVLVEEEMSEDSVSHGQGPEDPGSKARDSSEINGNGVSPQLDLQNGNVNGSSLVRTVKDAQDIETILSLSRLPNLALPTACQMLFSIGNLRASSNKQKHETDLTVLEKDDRFRRLCAIVQNGNHVQNPQSLLNALRGLRLLEQPSDSFIVKELENELKWIMRRCPVRFLARTIEILTTDSSSVQGSSSEKSNPDDCISSAIRIIQRRWVEVQTGSDFISTFKVANYLSEETRSQLEDRATELIPQFTALELVKLVIVLGKNKSRPTPLLRSLAFHLTKSSEKLPVKDLIELVYGLNQLTYSDAVLLEKLCGDLHSEIASIENPALVSSLVTSLGQMRYKHKELERALENWIGKNLDKLRPFDCAAWILTCSVLNIPISHQDGFLTRAKDILNRKLIPNPFIWLNIIHALLTLNEVSTDQITGVLDPEFVKTIDETSQKTMGPRIKLLNINAAAEYKLKGTCLETYTGPLITKETIRSWTRPNSVAAADPTLSSLVLESLANFLPPPKYLRTNVISSSGVFIDALCMMTDKMDPIPIDPPTTPRTSSCNKIAILVLSYSNMTLGHKIPTGISFLSARLLASEGYRVVGVPYTEFGPGDKLLRRVQYLESKIKKSLEIQKVTSSPTPLS